LLMPAGILIEDVVAVACRRSGKLELGDECRLFVMNDKFIIAWLGGRVKRTVAVDGAVGRMDRERKKQTSDGRS
jgi:hypothetical protein